MSEIDFQIRIEQDSDARSFKRCVRYLLQHTFLLKDKDSKLYEFAVRSVNAQMLDSYFSVMGFAFITEKDDDICYIRPDESEEDTTGLRRLNVVPFSGDRYFLLLTLWQLYEEKTALMKNVKITFQELYDKLQLYGHEFTQREMRASLREFDQYCLISCDLDEYGTDMEIDLYPSIRYMHNADMVAEIAKIVGEEAPDSGEDPVGDGEEEDDELS